MKNLVVTSLFTLLVTGCVKEQTQEFTQASEIRVKPSLIKVAQHKNNFHLIYGNDASLEKAFNQYAKTGKASNIIADGFIKFAYNAGQQPIIKTAPFQETVLSLQVGERFTNISSGDPSRWSYSAVTSGSDMQLQQHVLVKPALPDISTNMVITTNKRIYNLRLVSTMNNKITRNVSFWYPDEMVAKVNGVSVQQLEKENIATVPDVSLNKLNFNYSVSCGFFCSLPSWAPLRVFDDGIHTYIQFNANMSNRDMPALFISEKGEKELVNYRSKPPYFVVDKIFRNAVLIIGIGQGRNTVTITNNHFS